MSNIKKLSTQEIKQMEEDELEVPLVINNKKIKKKKKKKNIKKKILKK